MSLQYKFIQIQIFFSKIQSFNRSQKMQANNQGKKQKKNKIKQNITTELPNFNRRFI